MLFRHKRHKHSLITVLVLLGALAVLWYGLGFANRSTRKAAPKETPLLNERGEIIPPPSGENQNAEPHEERNEPSDARLVIIQRTLNDAPKLLPGADGAAAVVRFWFASDRDVYVEYRRKGETTVDRMAFLVASGDTERLALRREALYGMGENSWEILEGNDVLVTKPQRDLYERDASGRWVKSN
jgi:hypothetical protein